MKALQRWLFVCWIAVFVAGCGPGPDTGPAKLAWDRDICEHCRMAISDRVHAAQLRVEGRRGALAFDDLGCALLWLDASEAPMREIWVRTTDGEGWADGTVARFEGGRNTPMGYGFGPVPEGAAGLGLEEVRAQVQAKEDERRSDPPHDHADH